MTSGQSSDSPLITPSKIYGSRYEARAKYKTTCRRCKMTVYVGDVVYYFPRTKKVEHYNCTRRRSTTGS